MCSEKIHERIHELVIKCINSEAEKINYDEDLREHGMDSVNCIAIIVEIEDLYNFEFADEDLVIENFMTINKLADYVTLRIGESKRGER